MTLNDMKIGQSAVVTAVGGEGALRRRLLDMGITPAHRADGAQDGPAGGPDRDPHPRL